MIWKFSSIIVFFDLSFCHFIVIMVSGFPPEKDFLEKIKAIDGVSQVETQTITNMEI